MLKVQHFPYAPFMRWFFGRSGMVQRTRLSRGETWTLEASLARMRTGPPRGFGGRIGAGFGGDYRG